MAYSVWPLSVGIVFDRIQTLMHCDASFEPVGLPNGVRPPLCFAFAVYQFLFFVLVCLEDGPIASAHD